MTFRSMSNYFKIGEEPYTCPNSTQQQNFNYPVVANSNVALNHGATITGGLTVDTLTGNTATFSQGLTVNSFSYFNSTLSILNPSAKTDNQLTTDVGGALLIVATTASVLPTVADENLSGLAIAWDIEPGSGYTDFINMAQGASGAGGFVFRTFNTTGIYQSLFSIAPKTLPVFTYGPVAYGHMNYGGTIAFAYPSTTTAVYNGASGVDTYSINIPGTWTTSQASQATIMTTICNTNVGLGAVTCAIIGMPSMVSGYLNFVIQVINASHQAQQCDFYYTVNCGNY